MQTLWQDLRYGARMLLKKPGFTLIAILTLALGIGANTAIFTVVDAALLRSLPYKAPERLYHLWEATPQKEYAQREFSYPDFQDYRQNRAFDEIAGYRRGGGILRGPGEPTPIMAPAASANFFSMLGVEPVIGRLFQPGEDKPGAERVTVLTYGLWQRMFGGDAGIIGQKLTIGGAGYNVVGVLPASFQFAPAPADLWLPYQPTETQLTARFMHGTNLIGRLKSGVSVEQAQAEMSAIASRIERDHNQSHAGTGVKIVPLREQLVGNVKPILLVLFGAVGFVLLIACANIASLLLTRSLARQKEVAVRSALGAGRRRIIRQLLTESALLALFGGAAGLLVASWGVDALVATLPKDQLNALPFLKSLRVDASVMTFTFLLSMSTGIVFGLAPALQATGADLYEALKEGGRAAPGGARRRLRAALVVTEIALSVVLLTGAGLMMKSLLRLLRTDVGFDPRNLLTMTVALPASKYGDSGRQVSFYERLTERLESLPGVIGAGTVDILPLLGGNTTRFNVEGDPIPPPGQEVESNMRVANETYFQTLGVPLLKGRFFDERDKAAAPGVVIINKSLADRIFASRDPIGRRLSYTGINSAPDQIIGVVGDVKITGLDEAIKPVLYYPYSQSASLATNLVVRASADPAAMVNTIREVCRALEPDVAIFNARTMEEMISGSPASYMRGFPALLIGVFAGVALLLASVGLYGVISYSVSQRTREIGLRMALGARAPDILKMVLKQGLALASVGLVIGAAGALALTRLLGAMLYEVSASDPATFALVSAALGVVASLACYTPARRATKVDPMVALRCE
jgi:putative ABC transport system permease protein